MLHKTKTLKGYTLKSLDGEIGKVQEFYFDDRHCSSQESFGGQASGQRTR